MSKRKIEAEDENNSLCSNFQSRPWPQVFSHSWTFVPGVVLPWTSRSKFKLFLGQRTLLREDGDGIKVDDSE